MKITLCIAAAVSAATVGHALAQTPPLTYNDLVREARKYEKLEGGERVVSNRVLFHTVKLDLKPFAGGSKDYFVKKSDEIGFICQATSRGFKGGTVVAEVVKHEEGAEGSHFYTLRNCAVTK
ncbi:hypothetical protein [Acidovorax sp. SUPP3334]|uniref:hypothetical protein n=1 Tax=Acidovorax sp. SUPP3334 TaxID=2920881 RepID=UPI0023DE3034|nr:hypothetical protein [Acidovorax sp. SUPP3334]GKT26183.1 hypothetical protein AVHM3334_20285 [Acidovorax sp. SUPP3334]